MSCRQIWKETCLRECSCAICGIARPGGLRWRRAPQNEGRKRAQLTVASMLAARERQVLGQSCDIPGAGGEEICGSRDKDERASRFTSPFT